MKLNDFYSMSTMLINYLVYVIEITNYEYDWRFYELESEKVEYLPYSFIIIEFTNDEITTKSKLIKFY